MPTLSRARRTVFEYLQEQGRPTTLATLVSLTGLHENTLRGHLDGLAADGLVTRERDMPHGRGRPAWLWRVRRSEVDEYSGLAGALARTLRRTSAHPIEDAVDAGQTWGRELAAGFAARPRSVTPEARVRDLFDRLGFGPEGTDVDLRLTSCPLLEVASEEPEIVCNVHLGLAVGASMEYGAEAPDAHLVPFAEPGACRLRLRS